MSYVRAWSNLSLEASKMRKHDTRISFASDWGSKHDPTFIWYNQLPCTKFLSLQYRKERERPFCHEFLCVKLTNGDLCRIERFGDPNARTDALTAEGSLAHDHVTVLPAYDPAGLDKTSDVILNITFKVPQDILDILKICYHMQQDMQSKAYTLQRFNCYFFCWCVLAVLLEDLDYSSWHTDPDLDDSIEDLLFPVGSTALQRGGREKVELLVTVGRYLSRKIRKGSITGTVIVALGLCLALETTRRIWKVMAAIAGAWVIFGGLVVRICQGWTHPKWELAFGMCVAVLLGTCMGVTLTSALAIGMAMGGLVWILVPFVSITFICAEKVIFYIRAKRIQEIRSSVESSPNCFTDQYIVPHGFRVEELGLGDARTVVLDIQDAIKRICTAMGRQSVIRECRWSF